MISWLDRMERIQLFDNYLKFQIHNASIKRPSSTLRVQRLLKLALHPAALLTSFITTAHEIPDFTMQLQTYFQGIQDAERPPPPSLRPTVPLPSIPSPTSLNVWYRVKFMTPNIQVDSANDFVDIAVSRPRGNPNDDQGTPARFDPVLVRDMSVNERTSFGVRCESLSFFH